MADLFDTTQPLQSPSLLKGPGTVPPMMGPPLPEQEEGVPPAADTLLRVIYGLGRGAVGGTAGIPIDLVNLVSMLESLPYESRALPELPGGSQDIQQWIDRLAGLAGYTRPEPGSGTEVAQNIAGTTGVFAGPAWFLKGTQLAAKVPGLMRVLSTGSSWRDILMGLLSGSGGEIGKQILSESPELGHVIGSLAAPISAAVAEQMAKQATRRLLGVKPLTYEQQARMAIAAGEDIPLKGSEVQGSEAVARVENFPSYTLTGTQPGRRFTEQQAQKAGEAVERALQPLELPGGGFPGTPETGLAMQQEAMRATKTAAGRFGRRYHAFVDTMGQRLGKLELAARAKEWAKETFGEFQKQKRVMYDATEEVTGNDGVLQVGRLRQTASDVRRESAQAGAGTPRGTERLSSIGTRPKTDAELRQEIPELQAQILPGQHTPLDLEDLQTLFSDPRFLHGLSQEQRQAITAFFTQTTDEPIPFWLGRRIQSHLGEIAYRRAEPIGTLTQGKARRMHWAISQDIDDFLTGTPEGQIIDPLLKEAHAYYKRYRTLFNESIVGRLMDKDPASAESFLNAVVRGQDLSKMQTVKENASPEVWEAIRTYAMARLYDEAKGDPKQLMRRAQPLIESGKLDILLDDPGARARFDRLLQESSAFDERTGARVAKLIAKKDPEQVPAFVFQPGKITRTQEYKAGTPPAVFDQGLRSWVGQLIEQAQTTQPLPTIGRPVTAIEKVLKQLEPMVVRHQNQPSQLDVMFTQYPGVSDRLTDLTSVLKSMRGARGLGINPSGTAHMIGTLAQIHTLLGEAAAVGYGALTGNLAQVAGGVGSILTTAIAPYAYAKWVYSPMGRRILSEGIRPRYSQPAMTFALRVLGADSSTGAQPPMIPGTQTGLTLDIPTAQRLLDEAGGDPDQAEALARSRGYEIPSLLGQR